MKNYMVTHIFKSAEMKKITDTVASMKMEDIVKSMKSDNAACQMTWKQEIQWKCIVGGKKKLMNLLAVY